MLCTGIIQHEDRKTFQETLINTCQEIYHDRSDRFIDRLVNYFPSVHINWINHTSFLNLSWSTFLFIKNIFKVFWYTNNFWWLIYIIHIWYYFRERLLRQESFKLKILEIHSFFIDYFFIYSDFNLLYKNIQYFLPFNP